MGRIKSYFSWEEEFEIDKHWGEHGPWVPQGIPPISYNLCEIAKDVDKVLLNPLCYEFWEREAVSLARNRKQQHIFMVKGSNIAL